jgi:putative transposase
MMKQVAQRYVQFINRTYQRSGTLWEGRFRSCIVGEEAYVLGSYRYIELSPVRAGLVSQPGDYRWSSFSENTDEASSLLTPHAFMQNLELDNTDSKLTYSQLFNQQENKLDDEIRNATNGNLVLGSESFQREIGTALEVRTWRGKAGRPKRRS